VGIECIVMSDDISVHSASVETKRFSDLFIYLLKHRFNSGYFSFISHVQPA